MIQNGQIIIRTETASDFAAVSDVVRQAFGPLTESDHKEHLLVGRLRTYPGGSFTCNSLRVPFGGTVRTSRLLSSFRLRAGKPLRYPVPFRCS